MRILLTAFVALLFGTVAHGEGLICRLPKDGAWVKYKFTKRVDESADSFVTQNGTMTLASVGVVERNDGAYRWIELTQDITFGGRLEGHTQELIYKMLLREENLLDGKDPLANVARLWVKRDRNIEPDEISDNRLKGYLEGIRRFFHGPFKEFRESRDKTLAIDDRKFVCTRLVAIEMEVSDAQIKRRKKVFDIHKHAESPFGVISYRYVQESTYANGSGKLILDMKFKDQGTGALSALPNNI